MVFCKTVKNIQLKYIYPPLRPVCQKEERKSTGTNAAHIIILKLNTSVKVLKLKRLDVTIHS